ncbi:isoepoxydon dehydrogenase [Aspergillus uvarum CBS 121591]|uniref:Isoepoxydon dehydrogenase n=1 Tax=Aspergillus uvarum CBS 121591 TaxID=1448315 RepID=A0A319CHD4_9EURO|nr:isoepoxydon dehydrogenase [Aspergillus uvarum CBS 121591]PYH83261.1 isoepoxydon dehydrogenase [Aspergillus uvarum CBS 121591]
MPLETGLQGAHVLITGGTRGMGQAMVRQFLQEGANVSYCARTVTNTEFNDVHQTLPESNSARAVGTAFDVASKEAIVNWVNSSAERVGRIDVIIANASPMHMEGETEHWESSFAIDVMGFVELVKAAEPYLEKSPQASIIVQSSFMGREFYRSPPAAYGPCKAAQLQHVQELSHYLGPKGIRVNAISPGPVLCEGGPWELYSRIMPEWVEEQRLKIPLKRLGGPQEIANVAVFLASPLASFVTGTNVLADGGIHVGTQF